MYGIFFFSFAVNHTWLFTILLLGNFGANKSKLIL